MSDMYNIIITTADLREILVEAFRDEGGTGLADHVKNSLSDSDVEGFFNRHYSEGKLHELLREYLYSVLRGAYVSALQPGS